MYSGYAVVRLFVCSVIRLLGCSVIRFYGESILPVWIQLYTRVALCIEVCRLGQQRRSERKPNTTVNLHSAVRHSLYFLLSNEK